MGPDQIAGRWVEEGDLGRLVNAIWSRDTPKHEAKPALDEPAGGAFQIIFHPNQRNKFGRSLARRRRGIRLRVQLLGQRFSARSRRPAGVQRFCW